MMKRLIAAMPEDIEPARRLEAETGLPLAEIGVHKFPDGESLVRAPAAAETVFLYCSLNDPNGKLVDLGLAASALREAGAKRLVLIAPYLCYMRQDKAFHPGEAVAQRFIGALLAQWFDRVITVEPHLHRTKTLTAIMPGIESSALPAAELLAALIRRDGEVAADILVVGPDAESQSWTSSVAAAAGAAFMILAKHRSGDRDVSILAQETENIAGKHVYLVDDIVSTGATLSAAASLLKRYGAARIDALVVHALFNKADEKRMLEAGIASIRSTDTVAHETNAIEISPLLAAIVEKDEA
ncbi:ribose-phosphate diphosphokinase [Hyphococcus sp.]|uniref:ribose-phosphate diphosphokinase n=1 Tax=Hyphococcus sp. TaxID=2038636 RepID=UPI0035C71AE7